MPSNARLRVSAKLLTVLTVAATMTAALFLSGCASSRKSVASSAREAELEVRMAHAVRSLTDSVSEVTEVRTEALTVPMSAVSLRIATDSLLSLPGGSGYSDRQGQARVEVRRIAASGSQPEYIYVYATCDSLQLQCERYERQLRVLSTAYSERGDSLSRMQSGKREESVDARKETSCGLRTPFEWLFFGFIAGVSASFLFPYIINLIKPKKQ